MSRIFFKLETFSPNLRSTYFKHSTFARYIATSQYVIPNQNTTHGLFGKVDEIENIDNNESIIPVEKHIKKLAENKRIIHRGLISMREWDAQRLGYLEQEKWKDIFIKKINDFAKMLNIPVNRVQYVASVHIEKGHPHCQFMVWDSKEEVRKAEVDVKLKNDMRKKLISHIFKEDLLPYYQTKDLIKKDIKQSKIIQNLIDLSYDEKFIQTIKKLEEDFYNEKILCRKVKNKDLQEIVKELIILKSELPKNGRLAYQYLIPELKEKVDKISKLIIDSSRECKEKKKLYIDTVKEIKKYQISTKSKMETILKRTETEAEHDILNIIGNRILEFEKNLFKADNISQINMENKTKHIVNDIFVMLSQLSSSQYADYYKMYNKEELSQQAKKEKWLENRAKSNFEWESDDK